METAAGRSKRRPRVAIIRLSSALVLTAPFIPMLFQGEEWGASSPFLYFTDHADPELARDVTAGRRQEFSAFAWSSDIPDPQALASFERSKLNWSERTEEPHAALIEWNRRLIELRRNSVSLSDGSLEDVQVNFNEAAKWLVMERGPFAVACNLTPLTQVIPTHLSAAGKIVLTSEKRAQIFDGELVLPPDSVVIVKSDSPQAAPDR